MTRNNIQSFFVVHTIVVQQYISFLVGCHIVVCLTGVSNKVYIWAQDSSILLPLLLVS